MVTYTTYVKFAGGLQPGTFVRFGGLKVGTVRSADIDPQDSTHVRQELRVRHRAHDVTIRAPFESVHLAWRVGAYARK